MVWPPTEGRVFGLAVIMVDGCNPVWEGGSVSSFLPQRGQGSQSIYCLFLGTLSLGGESGRGNVNGLVWLMGRTFGVLEVLWRRLPEDPHPNLPPAGGRDFVGWAFPPAGGLCGVGLPPRWRTLWGGPSPPLGDFVGWAFPPLGDFVGWAFLGGGLCGVGLPRWGTLWGGPSSAWKGRVAVVFYRRGRRDRGVWGVEQSLRPAA